MGGVADQASDRGLVIVNVTQCSSGTVEPHYATGQSLAAAGVVAGGDMTPEAALTKLVRLLLARLVIANCMAKRSLAIIPD